MLSKTFMCGNSAPRWKTMLVGRRCGGQRRDILAADPDVTARGKLEAGNDAKQRRLAAAARAEKRDELALVDREVDLPSSATVSPKRFRTPTISTAAAHPPRLRPDRLETITRQTSERSRIEATALIEGSTPRRIRPQTSTGRVCWLPMLNQVTTNSSSDSAAASSAAPMSDGRISGKVMSRKAREGEAPRSRAASSDA